MDDDIAKKKGQNSGNDAKGDKDVLHVDNELAHEESLARALLDARLTTCETEFEAYTLAVVGPWGSGKTHFVNRVKAALPIEAEQRKMEVCVISFEPWTYVSLAQLVEHFFLVLAEGMGEFASNDPQAAEGRRKKNNGIMYRASTAAKLIGKVVATGATAAESFSVPFMPLVKAAGNALQAGGEAAGEVADDARDKRGRNDSLFSEVSIDMRKRDIARQLAELDDLRIVVVIDNIDRLHKERISALFQLVAAIADFPNVSYLLAFDRQTVCQSIGRVQSDCREQSAEEQGARYLEKVVNVWYELPPMDVRKLVKNIAHRNNDSLWANDELAKCLAVAAPTPRALLRIVDSYESELLLQTNLGLSGRRELLGDCVIKRISKRLYDAIHHPLFTAETEKYIEQLEEMGGLVWEPESRPAELLDDVGQDGEARDGFLRSELGERMNYKTIKDVVSAKGAVSQSEVIHLGFKALAFLSGYTEADAERVGSVVCEAQLDFGRLSSCMMLLGEHERALICAFAACRIRWSSFDIASQEEPSDCKAGESSHQEQMGHVASEETVLGFLNILNNRTEKQ